MQSRTLKPLAAYFPDVVGYLRDALPPGAVMDGELVIWDEQRGRTSFALLHRRIMSGRSLAREAAVHPANLVLWDLLHDGTRPLLREPLWSRRQRLADLLTEAPPQVTLCPQTDDPAVAQAWLQEFSAAGVEGVVIKGRDSRYEPGRRGWAKLRARATTEALLAGITGTRAAPEALLLGRLDSTGRLRYVGRTTPLTALQRRELAPLLRTLPEQSEARHPWPSPLPAAWSGRFGNVEALAYVQVPPELVVEVSEDIAYEYGRWRHPPRFVRVRPDLSVIDVPLNGTVDE